MSIWHCRKSGSSPGGVRGRAGRIWHMATKYRRTITVVQWQEGSPCEMRECEEVLLKLFVGCSSAYGKSRRAEGGKETGTLAVGHRALSLSLVLFSFVAGWTAFL